MFIGRQRELKQLATIKNIQVSETGFVCSGGFAFKDEKEFILINGEQLYSII